MILMETTVFGVAGVEGRVVVVVVEEEGGLVVIVVEGGVDVEGERNVGVIEREVVVMEGRHGVTEEGRE